LRFPRSGRSGAHLRDQRQLPEARPCLEAIQGEEKEDHQKPSHQIGHQSREEPGGCWMLERDHDDHNHYIFPSMVMEKLEKHGFHEQLNSDGILVWVGGFNHLEKY